MEIDMSPQAVTNRMIALDQLWELATALKSSKIVVEDKEPIPDAKLTKAINVPDHVRNYERK
ncbi:MAG: hypothetical protein ABIP78_09040 [Pyrinomonadaceae bacterium]